MSQIKKIAKKFIEYILEGEYKTYRLKGTPIKVAIRFTKEFHGKYEKLPLVSNKIVFDNYMGKGFGCNGKYVTQALLASGRHYDIVWTVKDANLHRDEFPKGVRLVEYGSKEAMYEYATAKIWVMNYQLVHYLNKGMLKKPGQIYIQMWHGSFGIKKIEGDCSNLTADVNWTTLAKRNAEYTDYWISNSRFETEVYKQAFWTVKRVLELGHARNDIFFREDISNYKEKLEREYGLKHKKIALYVPTFRDEGMIWEQELNYKKLVENLSCKFGGDWVVCVRLHPRMKEYAKQLIPKEPYVVDVTEYQDIQELLAGADVVLTDYSSAIFDFLLTKKPGFIFVPDYSKYENMRGLYYPLEETPFPVASDNEELEKNIIDFDLEIYQDNVRQFLEQKGSVEAGDASDKIAELIAKITVEKESDTWNI